MTRAKGGPPHKLVVISDTHGDTQRLERLLPIINSSNYLVFCGDGLMDVMYMRGRITVPLVCVKGNNDLGLNVDISDMATVAFGSTRALVTHGHRHAVYYGLMNLYNAAAMQNARLVFFGHTHQYYDGVHGGIHFINPGALCNGSYAIVEGDGTSLTAKPRYV